MFTAHPAEPASDVVGTEPTEIVPGKKRSRFALLRSLCCVANGYMRTKRMLQGVPTALVTTNEPAAFRRAFVWKALHYRPVACTVENGIARLDILGKTDAVACNGAFLSDTRLATLGPAPIADLCREASKHCMDQLTARVKRVEGAVIDFHPAFPAMFARYLRPVVISVIKRFLTHVDPEAIRVFRKTGIARPEALRWLTPPDRVVALRRRQALELFPMPLRHLRVWDNPWSETAIAIDDGKPLLAALKLESGLSGAALRRLRSVNVQRTGYGHGVELPVEVLNWVPPDWMPTRRKGFAALQVLRSLLDNVHLFVGRVPKQARVRTLLKGTGGLDAMELRPVDVGSFADTARDLISNAADENEAVDFIASLSVGSLRRLSDAWHEQIWRARLELNSDVEWPAGFPELPFSQGGRTLIELTKASELMDEGRALRHCVSSYAARAMNGVCRILSVRDAEGLPSSTVEMDTWGRVVQHRGDLNQAPRADDAALVLAFAEALEKNGGKRTWPVLPYRNGGNPDMRSFWEGRVSFRLKASARATAEVLWGDEFIEF